MKSQKVSEHEATSPSRKVDHALRLQVFSYAKDGSASQRHHSLTMQPRQPFQLWPLASLACMGPWFKRRSMYDGIGSMSFTAGGYLCYVKRDPLGSRSPFRLDFQAILPIFITAL